MLKLFLSNRAIVVLLLPIIIGVYLGLSIYTHPQETEPIINLGLFGLFQSKLYITTSISFVLVFVNAYLINFLFNKNEFYDRNMYAPALLYVVLLSYYHSFYSMDGLLISHSFLILCLFQLFALKQNEDGRRTIFNASFFAGVAAIIHPPIIVILPLLFMMVWSVRPFVLRESLLLLSGFSIPLLYGGIYLTWLNTNIDIELLKQVTRYEDNLLTFYISLAVLAIFSLLAFIGIQQKMQKSAIRFKKLVRILWLLLVLGLFLGCIDFLWLGQLERFSILLIPICFFLPHAFISKSWAGVGSFFFYLTLLFSFVKFFI